MAIQASISEIVSNNEKNLLSKKKEWSRLEVKNFAKLINGFAFKSNLFVTSKEGVPIIRIRDIHNGQTEVNYIGDYEDQYLVSRGDVLIGMDGDFKLSIWSGEKGLLNQRVCKIILDEQKYNKKFFCYIMPGYLEAIHKKTSSVTVKHLSSFTILDTPLPNPPLQEQTLIVQEIEKQFTRLDEAVKSLTFVKEKLELYRKAILNKSFHGDGKTLSQIARSDKHSIKRGPFGGSLKKEIFVPRGYKVYEQKHAIRNDFNIGSYYITKEKFEAMKMFSVKPGDFIISCSGTIGKIAEVPEEAVEGIINQALLKLSLDNSKILNKYFQYVFQSEYIQRHLTKVSRGVAIKNVPSVKELKTIKFPVPSIQEQINIVQSIESKFSVIDKIEQVVEISLEKSEKLRKSILKSAFEGKLVKMEELANA